MPRRRSHILELARRGAEHRYRELKAEIAALLKDFPHLAGVRVDVSAEPAATIDRMPRRRMSAAARKRISEAQKARWAKVKAGRRRE